MDMKEILEILKDYFTFAIPLGVVLIIIVIIIYVYSMLFKEMKISFESQIKELRETHKMLLAGYIKKENQLNKRITNLENMLNKHLKGGKKK